MSLITFSRKALISIDASSRLQCITVSQHRSTFVLSNSSTYVTKYSKFCVVVVVFSPCFALFCFVLLVFFFDWEGFERVGKKVDLLWSENVF